MKQNELFTHTFKALRQQLGHDHPRDGRPLWQQSLRTDSVFCRALVSCGYLTTAQMLHAAQRYRLGRTRDGGVIFWQIDEHNMVHEGKVMYYHCNCHRDHQHHPTWVSFLLKRKYGCMDVELATTHCLFGLHLLGHTDNTDDTDSRPICVVEAEKTAVILSEVFPQYLWMAAGGLNMLSVEKLLPLRNHKVTLFPDTDPDGKAYAAWLQIAEEASKELHHHIYVSDLLERQASLEQKARKIDLVDYLYVSQKCHTDNTDDTDFIFPCELKYYSCDS